MSDQPIEPTTTTGPQFRVTCITDPVAQTSFCSQVPIDRGPRQTGTSSAVPPGGEGLPKPQTTHSSPTPVLSSGSSFGDTTQTAIGASPTTIVPSVQSSSKTSSGVSPGAVAGIAIATAIIGAVIAFAIAFFLFKRKRRNAPISEKYDSNPELVSLSKGHHTSYSQNNIGTTSVTPTIATAGPLAPRGAPKPIDLANLSHSSDFLAGILPPAADDATLRSKVTALFDQISRHVDTFYRDVHASVTASMETDLSRFGRPEASGGVPMVELLQNCQSPTSVIKHALSNYIINITNPEISEANGEVTLFPRDVVGVAGSQGYTSSSDLLLPTLIHRALSVHLHTTSHNTDPTSAIREAAEHFALTFFPWANPGYNDAEKDEDLVQIISKGREVALWLFGQLYVTEWVWESSNKLRGVVTIRPGLVRKSDGEGRRVGGVAGSGMDGVVIFEPVVVGT
ncbi:hypothetical protein B0J11DRAFT_509759 [Dendryphion nanum]|uniref:Uncharacterized protein n=1 Tax=Dendryphion nanum TaxID=256645 RepID=A0A9P9DD23_9PLEO|nr:hypothetical protein B0J11DRAFT_509759 [Dendryphion nanum]